MIRDGTHYSVYSDEVDYLIVLVHQHHPLGDIERSTCPKCGASVRVGFWPDGRGFLLQCAGKPFHMSTYQAITSPPAWWRQRVIEVTDYLYAHAKV